MASDSFYDSHLHSSCRPNLSVSLYLFLDHIIINLSWAIRRSTLIFWLTVHSVPAFNPYPYEWATTPTCSWRDHEIVNQAFVPTSQYGDRNINCHVGATPADLYVEVIAGHEITLQWTEWPESHHGPVITYLGNCNGDCTTTNLDDVEWVKIDAVGQVERGKTNSDSGVWGADLLRTNGNKASVTIPESIQAGNYLCRHEIIALMGASNLGKAQNYPNCINLKITGSGTDPLASGTKGVDLYKETDPGIKVMIYGTTLNYQIPGPPLYTGATGGTSTSPGSNSTSNNSNDGRSIKPTRSTPAHPYVDNPDKPTPYTSAHSYVDNPDKPVLSTSAYPYNASTSAGLSPYATRSSYSPQSTGTKPQGYSGSGGQATPKVQTPKPDDYTTPKPNGYTKPREDGSTTAKSDDYTTPKPDSYTTPKSQYTSTTDDSDLKIPEGANASQLLDIIDRVVKALRKTLSTKRRRHARDVSE